VSQNEKTGLVRWSEGVCVSQTTEDSEKGAKEGQEERAPPQKDYHHCQSQEQQFPKINYQTTSLKTS
jgi:hypothetical protein